MTFATFATHLSRIDATTKRLEMTDLLVGLLKESSAEEIDKVVYLSLGQLAPLFAHKEFGLAEKMVLRAVALAYGVSEERIKKLFKSQGDLGTVAEELANSVRQVAQDKKLTVDDVFQTLTTIADDHGEKSQERKLSATASLLKSVDPLSAKFVARIILDKLRLGFSDKTVLDALSVMIRGDKSERQRLEAMYNVRPDVGWLAKEVKSEKFNPPAGGKSLHITPILGTPVVPALCQRLPSTEEIIEKMCRSPRPGVGDRASTTEGSGVAVEPKWDGQRIQAHVGVNTKLKVKSQKSKVDVQLFTRSLEDVTDMFPDLVSALSSLVANPKSLVTSFILDGEVVGVDSKTGKFLPFQTMITRKRKYGVAAQLLSVPIRYMVFDILMEDGTSLLNAPFSDRRAILEKLLHSSSLVPRPSLSLAPQLITNEPKKIREFLEKQQNMGLEGIVTKKWGSPYSPGRTGFHWVKLKWEGIAKSGGLLDTVDCVVMGTYVGRGKRSGFGVGAFLAGIYSPNLQKFLTISKIGTGLSDGQWKELQVTSRKLQVKDKPKEYDVPKALLPDRWLEPKLVAEIQADNLTKSPLHSAGFALRFPRLVRYRTDKKPGDSTTVKEVERLFKLQEH